MTDPAAVVPLSGDVMLTDGGVTSGGVPINRTGFHRYGWAYDLGAIPAQSK